MGNYPAVHGTNEVLVIKDNKIIGSATVNSSYMGRVIVRMNPSMFDTIFADDDVYKTLRDNAKMSDAEARKWATFAFSEYSGVYDGSFRDEAETRGEGLRIVSKFHLRFGMVPDSFKDVETYNIVMKELND